MNTTNYKQIGLGGGCHWCTEAVFASLIGVQKVAQGWIASAPPDEAYSEAVIVTYDPQIITLKDLIEIHVHTHAATSNHSMRHKYRSAIYWLDEEDAANAITILAALQKEFEQPIITSVLPFIAFKLSIPEQINYYYTDPERPFCKAYINPKLQLLKQRFTRLTNMDGDES